MTARCVMVLGTSRGAGQDWLATALCRWFARQGLRVARFEPPATGTAPWPQVRDALDALRARHDVVVIAGAGIADLRVATHAQARCLLVADAAAGGAFSHLYETSALVPHEQRALLHGFVLDRVDGDPALLEGGAQQLERLTGVPVLAMLPVVDATPPGEARATIGIVAGPGASQLGDFQPLASVPGVRLQSVRTPAELASVDWVILPGSRAPASDLEWLRRQGLAAALVQYANAGGRVLGLGGGLQMLGEALVDPSDIAGNGPGLGLLPLVTLFGQAQETQRVRVRFEPLAGPWAALSGLAVEADALRTGRTAQHAGMAAGRVAIAGGLGWQNDAGNVLGVLLHGWFGDAGVREALFERLADVIEQAFVAGALPGLIAC